MKKILTLLISFLLPGFGQIIKGFIAVGMAFFVAEVILANTWVYVTFRLDDKPHPNQMAVLYTGMGLLWAGAQAHLIYLLFFRNPERFNEQRVAIFKEGLQYYLKDELDEAIARFDRLLRYDQFDCDAWLYLGTCYSRAGNRKKAKYCFKRCVEYDDDRKWAVEVKSELEMLSNPEQAPAEQTSRRGLGRGVESPATE